MKRSRIGFADNLAAYPLVQRLCQTIVVVDGEHDPTMQFESLRRLNVGLTLEGRGLRDQPQSVCKTLPGKHALEITDTNAKLGECAEGLPFSADQLEQPVFSAQVGGYPYWDSTEARDVEPLTSRVVYVKLGLDEKKLNCSQPASTMSPHARRYCGQIARGQHGCTGAGLLQDCTFPQQSTTHQCFSREDFDAYRSLGKEYGERAARMIQSRKESM